MPVTQKGLVLDIVDWCRYIAQIGNTLMIALCENYLIFFFIFSYVSKAHEII